MNEHNHDHRAFNKCSIYFRQREPYRVTNTTITSAVKMSPRLNVYNTILLKCTTNNELASLLLIFVDSVSLGVGHHCAYLRLHQPHSAPRGFGALAHLPVGAYSSPPPVHHVRDQLPIPAGKRRPQARDSSHSLEI